MARHPDLRVILDRFGSRQQDEFRVRSFAFGTADELLADALMLEGLIDGQIRQIGAVHDIADRPRHPDQLPIDPCGHKQIRVGQHAGDAIGIIDGSAFSQCGTVQHINEFGGGQIGFEGVMGHGVMSEFIK